MVPEASWSISASSPRSSSCLSSEPFCSSAALSSSAVMVPAGCAAKPAGLPVDSRSTAWQAGQEAEHCHAAVGSATQHA